MPFFSRTLDFSVLPYGPCSLSDDSPEQFVPFPPDPLWIKVIGSCSASLMGNKPTKNLFPGTLYLGVIRNHCNILPVILINGRRYHPFTLLLFCFPLPHKSSYINSVVCGTFAQWKSSLKGNHFILGPYPPAPNSTDLLSSSSNKSSFSFTGSLTFHSIWQLGLWLGYCTLTISLEVRLHFSKTVLSSLSIFPGTRQLCLSQAQRLCRFDKIQSSLCYL